MSETAHDEATEQEREAAEAIAREYVLREKGWPEEDFEIEFLRRDEWMVLDAVHRDDLADKASNKSVQLLVDLEGRRVVEELGYQ